MTERFQRHLEEKLKIAAAVKKLQKLGSFDRFLVDKGGKGCIVYDHLPQTAFSIVSFGGINNKGGDFE